MFDWIKAIVVATAILLLWPILVAVQLLIIPVLVFVCLVLIVLIILKVIKDG